jgi:hypothetical protein
MGLPGPPFLGLFPPSTRLADEASGFESCRAPSRPPRTTLYWNDLILMRYAVERPSANRIESQAWKVSLCSRFGKCRCQCPSRRLCCENRPRVLQIKPSVDQSASALVHSLLRRRNLSIRLEAGLVDLTDLGANVDFGNSLFERA